MLRHFLYSLLLLMWCGLEALAEMPNTSSVTSSAQHNLEQFVPKARRPVVLKAIRQAFNVELPDDIFPLYETGYTNSSILRLKVGTIDAIIRLGDLELEDYTAREHEIETMSIMARRDIIPTIYYANTKEGITISQYIQREPLSANLHLSLDATKLWAKTLQEIHNGNKVPWHYDVFSEIYKMEAEVADYYPTLTRSVFAYVKGIEQLVKNKTPDTLCHNDLSPDNSMFDGKKIWVIDWDKSGMGDPYYDVATVANFYVFDREREQFLLESYLGHTPTSEEYAHFYLMRQVSLAYYGLSFLKAAMAHHLRFYNTKEVEGLPTLLNYFSFVEKKKPLLFLPVNQHKFALIMLNEMVRNVTSATFAEQFAILQPKP